ncbi:MAG TPA: malonyl CoA-acyl carrier protein transacylase, partial [Alcanivorax sp.]|nr:malonyl CoA-acyl carrier protein transacylase [Alcanivorax sp.]
EQSGGPRPNLLAGHSLGEYTALTCAGVVTLGDAVRLVRTRGQLMQQAVAAGEGKMAA